MLTRMREKETPTLMVGIKISTTTTIKNSMEAPHNN
jgi:hypothetical protein